MRTAAVCSDVPFATGRFRAAWLNVVATGLGDSGVLLKPVHRLPMREWLRRRCGAALTHTGRELSPQLIACRGHARLCRRQSLAPVLPIDAELRRLLRMLLSPVGEGADRICRWR